MLIDLFGELEIGTFENTMMEKESNGLIQRIKERIKNCLAVMKRNVLKITAIITGIIAFAVCVGGVIMLLTKRNKRINAIA